PEVDAGAAAGAAAQNDEAAQGLAVRGPVGADRAPSPSEAQAPKTDRGQVTFFIRSSRRKPGPGPAQRDAGASGLRIGLEPPTCHHPGRRVPAFAGMGGVWV